MGKGQTFKDLGGDGEKQGRMKVTENMIFKRTNRNTKLKKSIPNKPVDDTDF